LLVTGQIQLLDAVGLWAVAVSGGQGVIEVLALSAHAPDVERQVWFDEFAQPFDVFTDRQSRARVYLKVSQSGVALSQTGGQRLTPHLLSLFRQVEDRLPALGEFGGQLDVLRPQRCDKYRDAFAHRRIDELERFAQSGALVGGQRDRVVVTLVLHPFSAPHLPADFDHLAGARNRSVVGHPVETLDDLRTRRTQAEGEAAVGYIIQTGRGHRGQGGRSGVELKNAGSQLDVPRAGREVTQCADRIE
jgi:hypothetical protein